MKSKTGWALAGIYIVVSAYLIVTQGLFGESFIALILGAPWTLGLAAIEFGGAGQALSTILLIGCMVLNAIILYWVGTMIGRMRKDASRDGGSGF